MINAMQKLSFVPNDIIGEIKNNFDRPPSQTVQFSPEDVPPQEEGSSASVEKDGVTITKYLKDLPFKTFLIIGKTGTGKSSLCNRIVGHDYDSAIFPVSEGATSCTQSTILGTALFNGDKEKPPVNVIDTIGFDDPKNDTDVRIIAELVSKLKNNCDYVNLFGIAVNGQAPRLDGSLVAMIKIFEEMFGQRFWKQCVLLFTRISMNDYAKKKRARQNKKTDDQLASEYVREVEKMFPTSAGGLRYLYLDACYDEDLPEEAAHFQESMVELYRTFQLLEYQTDVQRCRFDTLGKLNSAHRAGAPTARERWVLLHGGQSSISLEYQTYTSAYLFDTLISGLAVRTIQSNPILEV